MENETLRPFRDRLIVFPFTLPGHRQLARSDFAGDRHREREAWRACALRMMWRMAVSSHSLRMVASNFSPPTSGTPSSGAHQEVGRRRWRGVWRGLIGLLHLVLAAELLPTLAERAEQRDDL